MEDTQRIVKCGNLALHAPGGFFKKRWHSKYLVLYDGSKSGIKRLEFFDSEIKFKKQSPVKIIPLVDCVRVVTCQRHKTTFTFEVRTSDQFYLLASKSFQDMNDWVNCLRFVAFGQQSSSSSSSSNASQQQLLAVAAVSQRQDQKQLKPSSGGASSSLGTTSTTSSSSGASSPTVSASGPSLAAASATVQKRLNQTNNTVDVLLERRQNVNSPHQQQVSAQSNGGLLNATSRQLSSLAARAQATTQAQATTDQQPRLTASQAAAAAASALAKTRQRQPSLLGSCKPQPPNDSPFIQQQQQQQQNYPIEALVKPPPVPTFSVAGGGQMDTLTPTVRGQLIAAATTLANQNMASKSLLSASNGPTSRLQMSQQQIRTTAPQNQQPKPQLPIPTALDEEEENMLYCSIEDNPSEHNYRVKVIETELALRCQLKCYQLTASTTVSEQYEELAQFRLAATRSNRSLVSDSNDEIKPQMVTFYQLIIGPQELTLLNDYAAAATFGSSSRTKQQQGLWSWPYQCIRRYGFDKDNCFMFEAGRKCTSGPGQFIVQTPKAYNIYQDVVKFVNELRTISATTTTTAAAGRHQQSDVSVATTVDDVAQSHQQPKQLIVTQIPVTWNAPANTNAPLTIPDAADQPSVNSSRRQFFDALRQFDNSQSASLGQSAADNRQTASGDCGTTTTNGGLPSDHNNVNCPTPTTGTGTGRPPNAKLTSHDFAQETLLNDESAMSANEQQVANEPIGSSVASSPASGSQTHRVNEQQQRQQQLANSKSDSITTIIQQKQLSSTCAGGSASDETDESGYEQGDESVDSARTLSVSSSSSSSSSSSLKHPVNGSSGARHKTTKGNNCQSQGAWASSTTGSSATSRLKEHSLTSSAPSMSSPGSSPTSSAGNSPGQSISRRTADSIGSSASGSSSNDAAGHQARSRPALPDNLTKSPIEKRALDLSGQEQKPRATGRSLHGLIADGVLGANDRTTTSTNNKTSSAAANSNKPTLEQADDFETSLIRDVYSEITKLHAKFAVTTNGADDSLSSGGESHSSRGSSAVQSSSSSSDNVVMMQDDDGQCSNEDDCDSMDGAKCAEPMYSNLRPVHSSPGRTIRSNSSRPTHQPNNNDHNQFRVQQQQMQHFDYIRPPLYPSILNPIPEIAEHQVASTHSMHQRNEMVRSNSVLQRVANINNNNNNNNSNSNSNNNNSTGSNGCRGDNGDNVAQLKDGLPRARLALNREAIKRSQQSVGQQQSPPLAQEDKSAGVNRLSNKPTNHYLINDVQYAKISRNIATGGGRLHSHNQMVANQRRR